MKIAMRVLGVLLLLMGPIWFLREPTCSLRATLR